MLNYNYAENVFKKLTVIAFFLLFISCNQRKNGINVVINNSSGKPIRNVIVQTRDKTKIAFDLIQPNQSVKKFLDMTNNQKADGDYELSFERENGKKEKILGGYYTNGGSLDKKVDYEIKSDTVLTKFSGLY